MGLKMHWQHRKTVRMFLQEYEHELTYYPPTPQHYARFSALIQ